MKSPAPATLERFTPRRAQELLDKNTNNRTVRPRKVLAYARAMERGEWDPHIRDPISMNGHRLLNGQHRLLAVIESGVTTRMWFATGVPEKSMAFMDTGLARNMTDTLKMAGEKYPAYLASLLRQVLLWKTEKVFGGKADRVIPNHHELLELLDKHPELREINERFANANASRKRQVETLGTPMLLSTGYWILSRIDKDDAEMFFTKLTEGTGLEAGDPILALRRLLIETVKRKQRASSRSQAACMVKAWNAWREGEDVYLLSWRGKAENFPRPI